MAVTAPVPAPAVARRRLSGLDPRPAWTWALTLALVLYLAMDGGGYDLVVRSRAGVALWWILLLGCLLGLLPSARTSRAGRVAVVVFAAFAAWSTLTAIWSLSSERSLDEASRLATYLGVLWLATITVGDRDRALRDVVGALALAIFVVAAFALLGRLRPGLFPGAAATGSELPGLRARLSWPLNYWNALGALMALGAPLLLAVATTARRAWARAAAAAALPAVILCGYLTFSRTSVVAAAVALAVFLALSPRRLLRVATAAVCAGGGGILVAETIHRHAVENGLTTHAAAQQGGSLLVLIVVVCLLVGLVHLGLTVGVRSWTPLSRVASLSIGPRPAAALTAVAVVVAIVAALALGAPHHLSHAYQAFKNPNGAHVHSDTIQRYTALSGNGRYTYWKATLDAMPGHWLGGFGLGSFQFVWLPRAPYFNYIVNAHSLYVETLVEVGIVGLLLLVAFLVTVLVAAVRACAGATPVTRTRAAAAAAACVSFVISAGFDWVWQVPVVPVAFLLVASAALAPRAPASIANAAAEDAGSADAGPADAAPADAAPADAARPTSPGRGRVAAPLLARAATVIAAIICLGLIGTPMAMTQAVRRSQSDVDRGRTTAALSAALTAVNTEPSAATPALQAALVLELERRYADAVIYARRATANEPQNWNAWLVRSRLEAEAGHARQAIAAFARARRLNPRSPVFQA